MIALTMVLAALAYDPLAVGTEPVARYDETWRDPARSRDVPIRVYLPAATKPAPLVLFSHGLGGSRQNNVFLGERLARRGYVALFVQHPGSDESVWRGVRPVEVMSHMRSAASSSNLKLRAEDVRFAIDEALRRANDPADRLSRRIDAKRIGVSGHSFGAMTSQVAGGMALPVVGTSWADPRVRAIVAYSPSPPRGSNPETAFGKVDRPWLLLTGTEDDSPIQDMDPGERRTVFAALPSGSKYECVLWGAEHSAFSERALRGDRNQRNPNHHRAMLGLTVAFWDAYLKEDASARAWLDGDGPRSILEAKDAWQSK